MTYAIRDTWDSLPITHDPIKITFSPGDGGLLMEVAGPFFNDPAAPDGPPGEPFAGLWDYEVVESFFLNSLTENYLEVEVCPHGQHLVLLLSGQGNAFLANAAFEIPRFHKWKDMERFGTHTLEVFPSGVNKMNSYAIHRSGVLRTYEALYPVPRNEVADGQKPNFHLLKYFKDFKLQDIMGQDWVQPESDLWENV